MWSLKSFINQKKKFFYQFNDNGYAVAISFSKNTLSKEKIDALKRFISKSKLKLNLSKTDYKYVQLSSQNNLFLSLYKKMLFK